MGELENALLDDWEESSSLMISDSEDFSCSSSVGSLDGSFKGLLSASASTTGGSSASGTVEFSSAGLQAVSVSSAEGCVCV